MQKIVTIVVFLMTPLASQAAGFALGEQSVSGLGNALAGMSARSDDASTQFYNPASMSFMFPGTQLTLGGNLIRPTINLNNSNVRNTTFGGIAVNGNKGGDAGGLAVVPMVYLKTDINERLSLGVGINAPFGLSTQYNSDWVGRYNAIDSELQTININPAIAWKVNEQFSIGGGMSVQYVKAKLTNAIDSSAICRARTSLATCSALGLAAPGSSNVDSLVKLEGDDIGIGFNLGMMVKPNDRTTLGLSFRSSVEQNLRGKAKFKRSSGLNTLLSNSANPAVNQQLMNGDITAQIELPESAALSGAYQMNHDLQLLADVTWTNWSRFKELRINFENPAQADGVTTENWKDAWRYSLGANYQLNPSLILRTGIAYDETPVRNQHYRTVRIPDQNRTWLSIGANWKMSPVNSIDGGYAHLFMKDATIDNTSEGNIKYNVRGQYEPSVNILSMQFTHNF